MFEPALDTTRTIAGLATAAGLGLLIGVERERNKGTGRDRAAAGIRTFTLICLAGALAQLVGPVGIAVAGTFVAWLTVTSYRYSQRTDPGLTTEIAMLTTFLLGIMALRSAPLAAGVGVMVVLVLAGKSRLHRFTRERLTQQELHDGLLLIAAAFVVLPLLPDRAIDPLGALNPRRLWILVVALMGISSAGYLALRLFGSRLGLTLAGLAGGFVSSTATIAAMGEKSRTFPALAPAFASAGLVSNVSTAVQMAIVIGALSPALLARAALPLAAAGMAAALAAGVIGWRARDSEADPIDLAGKRPFLPGRVLGFVALLGAIMVTGALAQRWLGERSLPWVLAASGLADVHASAASAAQLVAAGKVTADFAMIALAAAFGTNSLMKCVMAMVNGRRAYAARVVPGIGLMVAAFVVAAWMTR